MIFTENPTGYTKSEINSRAKIVTLHEIKAYNAFAFRDQAFTTADESLKESYERLGDKTYYSAAEANQILADVSADIRSVFDD